METELSLGTEMYSKRKDRKAHAFLTQTTHFKPQGPYPVFLFLFKFFFKFPNFPLQALDVLGELGNGLWLFAITTAAPRRTSGPAMIPERERIIKNSTIYKRGN